VPSFKTHNVSSVQTLLPFLIIFYPWLDRVHPAISDIAAPTGYFCYPQ
jgi:hypothetical protein